MAKFYDASGSVFCNGSESTRICKHLFASNDRKKKQFRFWSELLFAILGSVFSVQNIKPVQLFYLLFQSFDGRTVTIFREHFVDTVHCSGVSI